MRIRCNTFLELLENLAHIKHSDSTYLFENVIRISVVKNEEETASIVFFHLTTVVQTASHEYVLSYDKQCGLDYHDGESSDDASRLAESMKHTIQQEGWTILPGVIQE